LKFLFITTDPSEWQWLLDAALGWIRGDFIKTALQILAAFAGSPRLSFTGRLVTLLTDEVLPALRPFSDLPQQTVSALGNVFASGLSKGLSPLADDSFAKLLFEGIVDNENNADVIVVLLRAARLPAAYGADRLVPFIAARIVRIFGLRAAVTPQLQDSCDRLTRSLGWLPWASAPEEVGGQVVEELAKLLKSAQWVVQEQVLYFVHTFCFGQMFRLSESVYKNVHSRLVRVYANSERAELREAAISLTRMTIPIGWNDFGEFFNEAVVGETNDEKFRVANGVALIGAVVVVSGVPEWLPQLFELLESAARKVHAYESVINAQCSEFWKTVGARELPEIEDYRYAFSGRYFS
jgi:hypothetical protein